MLLEMSSALIIYYSDTASYRSLVRLSKLLAYCFMQGWDWRWWAESRSDALPNYKSVDLIKGKVGRYTKLLAAWLGHLYGSLKWNFLG